MVEDGVPNILDLYLYLTTCTSHYQNVKLYCQHHKESQLMGVLLIESISLYFQSYLGFSLA